MIKLFAALFLISCIAIPAQGTTYYVDYGSGSDSNNGTSKATAWKRAPGMLGLTPTGSSTGDGCASVCNSTTINPGDTVILKGGVVWPYTTLPWAWSFSGSGTSSTFGCTGSGCITITYDPTWNAGVVNSVTLTSDYGGCNPASPPTVAFSGGGGSSAAATANIIPAAAGTAEPAVAGFIYHITMTNQGSGYTSDPAVTISGTCTAVTAVADIFRPVIDAGKASSIAWPVGTGAGSLQEGPGLTVNANYVNVSGLEIGNILQTVRAAGAGIVTGIINESGSVGFDTFNNNYIHGRFTTCILQSCIPGGWPLSDQEQADSGMNLNNGNDEVNGNTLENGDAYETGTSSTTCATNSPCIFSESDIRTYAGGFGSGEIQKNYEYSIRWMMHGGGSGGSLPLLLHDNRFWLVLYDSGTAHVNALYEQFTIGTMYQYNNIWYACVSGSSNQQQMGNGANQYFFNNVSWACPGTGSPPEGIDGQTGGHGSAVHFYFWNNTFTWLPENVGVCENDNATAVASLLTVELQNNHCITASNPFYTKSSGSTYQNHAGSTTQSVIEASNTVQTAATANSQGYATSAGACVNNTAGPCAPTSSGNDTVIFASGGNSANLTSLCSGFLTPLCADIDGNARPASGGWNSGAFQFSGTPAAGTPAAAPGSGTYTSTQTVTLSVSGGAGVICYSTSTIPATNGTTGCTTGTLYTTGIPISSTTTLRAIAGGTGFTDGPVASFVYTISLPSGASSISGSTKLMGGAIIR